MVGGTHFDTCDRHAWQVGVRAVRSMTSRTRPFPYQVGGSLLHKMWQQRVQLPHLAGV